MPNTNFVEARRMIASFEGADLLGSVFSHANVKEAHFYGNDLTTANFTFANLQKTDFTDTQLSESQLQSALPIQDARLPNGTLGRDGNLITNGKADCNSSLIERWEIKSGNVTATMLDKNSSNCYFVVQSYDSGALMLQRIKLTNVWDPRLWPYSKAVLNARMGNGVPIQLNGMSGSGQILTQQ